MRGLEGVDLRRDENCDPVGGAFLVIESRSLGVLCVEMCHRGPLCWAGFALHYSPRAYLTFLAV